MIKIGVYGYGKLGRGVELASARSGDVECVGIFTRRSPRDVQSELGTKVYPAIDVLDFKGKIDVMVICGGSAKDLPEMTPRIAGDFSCVDSFDTHAAAARHIEQVGRRAAEGGNLAMVSAGWDPGLFSAARCVIESILPGGESFTFWGRGVSEGHSDAIRRVEGVADAVEYTVPDASAVEAAARGERLCADSRRCHRRECYVVLKEGADPERVRREIVSMPDYFEGYETTVTFIGADEMARSHSSLLHAGRVTGGGATKSGRCSMEFSLSLASNPEFTGSVLVAAARAVYRMRRRGRIGCVTMLDAAPSDLSPRTSCGLANSIL